MIERKERLINFDSGKKTSFKLANSSYFVRYGTSDIMIKRKVGRNTLTEKVLSVSGMKCNFGGEWLLSYYER